MELEFLGRVMINPGSDIAMPGVLARLREMCHDYTGESPLSWSEQMDIGAVISVSLTNMRLLRSCWSTIQQPGGVLLAPRRAPLVNATLGDLSNLGIFRYMDIPIIVDEDLDDDEVHIYEIREANIATGYP